MDKELKMGVKDEMEHTKSKTVAKKIAKDHLKKHSDYYSKLEKAGLSEGIKEKIKGIIRREKQKDMPIIQNRRDYAKGKAYDSYVKGDKKNGDRYMTWRKKSLTKAGLDEGAEQQRYNPHEMLGMSLQDMDDYRKEKKAKSKANAKVKTAERKKEPYLPFGKNALKHYKAGTMKLKEATLGGVKLAGKENPNNVKSKKSGFTINTKMNDAYSKVPDAKGLVRKRLLQKGKAAWNVGHAKKLAEDASLNPIRKAKSLQFGHTRKADNAFDRGDDAEMERQNDLSDQSKKRYKSLVKKRLKEGLKMGDYGHEKEKKDLAWRKKVQKEYDGPNREGKSASDGVRYTGD
jgi:hypothetical protein